MTNRGGRWLSLTILLAIVTSNGAAQGGTAAAPLKVGAYSLAQAARGDSVHRAMCSRCHPTADHVNADFKGVWFGQTVGALFNYIRSTMPNDTPGELSERDYLDVTAYILKLNGVASGNNPLVNDSTVMKKFKIETELAAKRP